MTDPNTYLPDVATYVLSHPCPRCGAPGWSECVLPAPRVGQRFHAPRIDRGLKHRIRDMAKSPHPAPPEPGRRYDTIREAS